MNPVELWAVNLRSWRRLDLALPEGCTAISGPNGAGKSTILAVIELALFSAKGELARQMSRDPDGDTCEVALIFDHAGRRYRVRRSYSLRAGKTLVAFDRADGAGWESLSGETAAATQQRLEGVLGLDRRTFRASSFIAQGDSAAFTLAQPRDRKDILAGILGLDVWERLAGRAAVDREREKALIERLAGQLAVLEPVVARGAVTRREHEEASAAYRASQHEREVARSRLGDLQRRVDHAAAKREQIERLQREVDAADGSLAQANQQHEQLRREIRVVKDSEPVAEREVAGRVAGLEADVGAFAAAREQWTLERNAYLAWREVRGERDRAVEQARSALQIAERASAAARQQLDAVRQSESCPTCGQALAGEARSRAVEQKFVEAGVAFAAESDATAMLQVALTSAAMLVEVADPGDEPVVPVELRAELERARWAVATVEAWTRSAASVERWEREASEVNERIARLYAEQIRRNQELSAALSGFDAKADTEARDELGRAQITAESLQERAVSDHYRFMRASDAVEALTEAEKQHDAAASDLHDAREALAAVTLLERAYGRNGIPAMLLEQAAIPQIEAEANRVLGELGTSFTTELRTQRQLKSGGQADALDIVVHSPDGEALYEDLSGGERTRVDVALRLGVARLLAHRKGAPVRFLAMDEPTALDDEGMQRLAAVLAQLDSAFDRIILVSHVPTLSDAFDQHLHVTKHDDQSSLSASAEAVLA